VGVVEQPCPSQRQKQLDREQSWQGGRGRRGRQSTGRGSLLMGVWGCSLAAERWRGATTLRAGGATNGPSPGCVSVTAAGLELGSRGFSSRQARVGRRSGSEGDDWRNGLRGDRVGVVEQRCLQDGRGRRRRREARGGAAYCCESEAADWLL